MVGAGNGPGKPAASAGETTFFIARAEAEHIVSTGVRIGAHLPAYCSATGRVLLSQFSDSRSRFLVNTATSQISASSDSPTNQRNSKL